MATSTFSYPTWTARYPEFLTVPAQLAQRYFDEAGLYLDPTDASPVADPIRRGVLLAMITAHIAALNAPLNGQPSSPLVGRITSASEGSVSVSVDAGTQSGSAAWWAQTKYGYAVWQALAPKRRFAYVPAPQTWVPF